jgi:spore coat polysaccharide biosynthesis protein SpsF
MRTVALIQARTSSRRLPGKVLVPLSGEPMIQRVLGRVKRCLRLDEIVLCTSEGTSDDPLVAEASRAGVGIHRGPLEDVLGRMVGALVGRDATHVVRLTADCPLLCPEVIDATVELAARTGAAHCYASTRTEFPRGLDTEVVEVGVLREAHENATTAYDREHVTPWIIARDRRFSSCGLRAVGGYARPQYRLCVDEADDLRLVRALYAELADERGWVDTLAVLQCLDERPEMASMNAHVVQQGASARGSEGRR